VPEPCTVLIAAPDLLPALKARAGEAGELLAFTDAEALRALEVITKRRPQVVALERLFAATPRGAALINRIKADPALTGAEIRVVSHDPTYARVPPREAETAPALPIDTPAPLDQRGTRRAPRFRIPGDVGVMIDGNPATVVDLSTIGAQVVSPTVLKPNQRVRVTLADDQATVRVSAVIAWASFEIPARIGPRYRAGIEFVDADPAAVDAYCARHRG
jgi:hypothetical protein